MVAFRRQRNDDEKQLEFPDIVVLRRESHAMRSSYVRNKGPGKIHSFSCVAISPRPLDSSAPTNQPKPYRIAASEFQLGVRRSGNEEGCFR